MNPASYLASLKMSVPMIITCAHIFVILKLLSVSYYSDFDPFSNEFKVLIIHVVVSEHTDWVVAFQIFTPGGNS